jgi:hypothetical protein
VSYSSPPASLVMWPTRAWTIIADDLVIDLSTPTVSLRFPSCRYAVNLAWTGMHQLNAHSCVAEAARDPNAVTGTKRDHTRNGAPKKACDKNLATMGLLRDNTVVGTPAVVADRWQAQQKARGWQGILAEGHRRPPDLACGGVTSWRWGKMVWPRIQSRLIRAPVGAVTSAN